VVVPCRHRHLRCRFSLRGRPLKDDALLQCQTCPLLAMASFIAADDGCIHFAIIKPELNAPRVVYDFRSFAAFKVDQEFSL